MRGLIRRAVASGLAVLAAICAVTGQTGPASPPAGGERASVIAGNLSLGPGYGGDGGAATGAQLKRPFGVAVDNAGNLFIADSDNNAVRKVDASGKITTVVRDPSVRDSSGKIRHVTFLHPTGLAVDGSGNVFIADYRNKVVLKMDPAGKVTIAAGTLESGGYSGDGGPATSAQLQDPVGLALDKDGNLFIADSANSVIREVDVNGIIHTVAGNKFLDGWYGGDGGPAVDARLNQPQGVAVDNKGNLFIADTFHSAIRKVDTNGNISTVAGLSPTAPGYRIQGGGYSGDGGAAVRAALDLPEGIAVNDAGELFIADSGNDVVRKVDSAGRIFTITGEHIGSRGQWDGPEGLAIDKERNLIIAYTRKSVIEKVELK